ncbi:MAG: sugar transferase [Candidatus Promineifilaceae bacterium]
MQKPIASPYEVKLYKDPLITRRIQHIATAFAQRLLDLFGSFFGLLILTPLFLVIAIWLKRDSPGPIFFWGNRMGRHEKPFKIAKFRTMYERPESYAGAKITGSKDNRITPIGKWLRDTKLNELPQLWNVLKGEMSLVGPRPEDPAFVKRWSTDSKDVILSVRPGITSPASVLYRDEESMLKGDAIIDDYLESIMPSKMRLDMLYVRHRTLMTDIDVLFWTIISLLPHARKRDVPEHLLLWGPWTRFVNHHFSWFVGDLITTFGAVGIAGLLWRSADPLHVGVPESLGLAVVIAVLFSVFNAGLGLNQIVWSRAESRRGFDLVITSTIVTILLLGANEFLPSERLLPPGMLVFAGVLAVGGFVGMRYRWRLLTGLATRWMHWRDVSAQLGERVLIIGAGSLGEMAVWFLSMNHWTSSFRVVGFADDAPSKRDVEIKGHSVLNDTDHLLDIVQKHDVGVLAFAIDDIDSAEKERILQQCRRTNLPIIMLPDMLNAMQGYLPIDGTISEQTDIPTQHISSWLNEIDTMLEAGDVDNARIKIKTIQEQMTQS